MDRRRVGANSGVRARRQDVRGSRTLRMCVGCRVRRGREELIRYCLNKQGTLQADLSGKLPGRGVYTCENTACVVRAVESGGFGRGLRRRSLVVDVGRLKQLLQAEACRYGNSLVHQVSGDGRARLGGNSGQIVHWSSQTWRVMDQRVARRLAQMEQLRSQLLGSEER